MNIGDKFYRIYAQSYSTIIDAEREEYGSTPNYLEESILEVVKVTPKGAWIDHAGWASGKPVFILNEAKKKFAYPTRELALDGFIAKKRRQKAILSAKLEDVSDMLNLALNVKSGGSVFGRDRTGINKRKDCA